MPKHVMSGVVVSILAQVDVVVEESDIELSYPADL